MCTSESMLTSANQYLRPEYLPPVSSPLDANKSPLALLAKTCSSIGVDTPSIKSLTGSSSNSSSSSSSNSLHERRTTPKSKSSDSNDVSSSKLNFKPYELSQKANHKSNDAEKRAISSPGKTTPAGSASSNKARLSSPSMAQSSPDTTKQQATPTSSSAPLSYTSLGLPDMHKDSLAAFYKAYGFLGPNCCITLPGAGYGNMMPPPIALDKTGAYPSIYPPTPSAAAAALAAYNYARVKGMGALHPGGNPLCRDPYCNGSCGQYGPMHNSHHALLASQALRESGQTPGQSGSSSTCTPATCPNGCNQCEHQRYIATIAAAYGSFSGLGPGMPYPLQMSASYASSLAAAAALHHRTGSTTGNVCNWIAGDTHCGKRFATSEELLQHLKSHTSSPQNQGSSESSSTATSTASSSAHLSTSSSPTTSMSQHMPTSGTPSPISQSRLSTSSNGAAVSPSPGGPNLLLHNNSRYHPYSKPLPPTSLPLGSFSMPPNGSYPPSPFGLPSTTTASSAPPFGASNLYYPYMTPSLFSGRIGPPVPP